MKTKTQLTLEKKAYHEFLTLYRAGKFRGQRKGQAFYDHFKLHRLSDQDRLRNLYELDGDAAQKVIGAVFQFS